MVEPTVIIVDDEPGVLDLLSHTLADHHFNCRPLANLQQAKLAVEADDADVVIADLALADGNGLDLLKHIRCVRPSLPVIIITGFPSIHVAEEAVRLGAFDLIEKPFNIHSLVEVVNEALATRQRQVVSVHETLAVLGKAAAFVNRSGQVVATNAHWEHLLGGDRRDEFPKINDYVAADSPISVGDLLSGIGSADSAKARMTLVAVHGPVAAEVTIVRLRERREQPGGYIVTAEQVDQPAAEAAQAGRLSVDPLTGCLSHRGFFEALEKARREALRRSTPMAILLIDIDNFSAINQDQGYDVGDCALRSIAGEIRGVLRETDLVGRYGADVFIAALHEAGIAEGLATAKRLCATLAARADDLVGAPLAVTSGVVGCPAGYTGANRDLADQAVAAVAWGRQKHLGPVIEYRAEMDAQEGQLQVDREEIERLTRKFAEANEKLKAAYIESARALVAAVEAKDPYTRRHSEAVAKVAEALAQEMSLPESYQLSILYAASLHDVGKIGIADSILTKPGPLSPEEFDLIKQHPIIGANIVSHVSCMRREVPLIQHHHENWDGSGYPVGLKGMAIPMGARILRVADSFDSIISKRSYKKAFSREEALVEIQRGRNTLYDPQAVEALESLAKRNPRLLMPRKHGELVSSL
jgi:diguanylate cyclase (GGDEF)-like protein